MWSSKELRTFNRICCGCGLCREELKMATHVRVMLLASAVAAGALFNAQSVQAATAAAQPHAIIADQAASNSNVVEVRRGWRGGWGYRRGWRGGWGYRRGWGGGWGYRRGWGGGWGYRRGWGGRGGYGQGWGGGGG